MSRSLLAMVLVFSGIGVSVADEPVWLKDAGLSSLKVANDGVGGKVRGMFGVRSTSLAQVSGVIYDSNSGSRFNIDSVNYGTALNGFGGLQEYTGAESSVLAGITGFGVTIDHADGGRFSATVNALSFGAGKGLISPQITGGPYPR